MSDKGDRFLLTLYPKGNIWSIDYLEVFTNDILDISPSISGTPPMFYYLMKIIITSLTTMLAFGSLVFATYRGFGSLGSALFLGVGTCLLASLFVLSALLVLNEQRSV